MSADQDGRLKPMEMPSAEALERIRALMDRQLTPEEVRAALAIPISPEELEENRSRILWFCRRYRTPAARLAWARRAYRRWVAAFPTPPRTKTT